MPVTLTLGNAAPLNPDATPAVIDNGCDHNQTETRIEFVDGDNSEQIALMADHPDHRLKIRGLGEQRGYYLHLLEVEDLWRSHGSDNPDWVESDDAELAQLVADHYGCPVGRPEGWGS